MKMFYGVIVLKRLDPTLQVEKTMNVSQCICADNIDEATGAAIRTTASKYPQSCGWWTVFVDMYQVDDSMIRTAFASLVPSHSGDRNA